MPDGEGFNRLNKIPNQHTVQITKEDYLAALKILLDNLERIAVYGIGNYAELNDQMDLKPKSQVEPDNSVIVGWAAPQDEALFQKFTRFSDKTLEKIDDIVQKDDKLSADAVKTNAQYCIATFKSINHLYNVLVALCNDCDDIGYDPDTDLMDVAGVDLTETELPRARHILFGGSGYGVMPRKRQLN